MTATMPTRVLVLGAGGREHAIAWKLASEPGVNTVFVAPGNAGMTAEPRVQVLPGVDALDGQAIVAAARRTAAELVVVGPEAPLAAGIADALRAAGFAVFGPGRDAARIESSKAFCHEIAEAAGVRMPRARAFSDADAAVDFARALGQRGHGVVVKADGLAAGKGVTLCDDAAHAAAVIRGLAPARPGADPFVVIEERLQGPEASLIVLTDGRDIVALPPARDHKRLRDGDLGPNTGGMGAYSPLPDVPDAEVAELVGSFHRPILLELARRGTPFVGALYAGLILTADGPVLLECNARFGDPETQVLMPRLASPIGPLLLAAARGSLAATAAALGVTGPMLPTLPGATVGIVLAAAGYPDDPRRGDIVTGLADAVVDGALVFHAGVRRDADLALRTNGGRVLAVVARGDTLAAAATAADAAADRIAFEGAQRRHDIARPEVTAGARPPDAASDRESLIGSGR